MNKPKATVLLPVYNAAPFLGEAIDSILNQTFSDFIFMIINDGSTDDSEKIILSYRDERIHYLKNDGNKGLIYTLNRGLELIETDYIIRMDADDISYPERFEKQIAFMDSHPDVAACGAQIQYFGKETSVTNFPIENDTIRAKMVFAPCINHPTAVIRTSVVRNNNLFYRPEFLIIEDYEYWIRVSKFGKLANLPEVLLNYRWEGQNITAKNWDIFEKRYKSVYTEVLTNLNITPSDENLTLHTELAFISKSIRNLNNVKAHRTKLLEQNKLLKIYPEAELKQIIEEAWNKLFFLVIKKGMPATFKYWMYNKSITSAQLRYFLAFHFNKMKSNKSARSEQEIAS